MTASRHMKHRWNAAEDAEIAAMRAAGRQAKHIASVIELPRGAVAMRISALIKSGLLAPRTLGPKRAPLDPERFWSRVDRSGGVNCCWPWTGATTARGYGKLKWDRRTVLAHRLAWEIANGRRMGQHFGCHSCNQPICCNPRHIRADDHAGNMRDMAAAGSRKGERAGGAKLTADDVREIRRRMTAGEARSALAAAFRTTPSNIHQIVSRRTWAHV